MNLCSFETEIAKAKIHKAIKSRLSKYERNIIIIETLQHYNTYKEDLQILDELT
jgi:hypothetical protein